MQWFTQNLFCFYSSHVKKSAAAFALHIKNLAIETTFVNVIQIIVSSETWRFFVHLFSCSFIRCCRAFFAFICDGIPHQTTISKHPHWKCANTCLHISIHTNTCVVTTRSSQKVFQIDFNVNKGTPESHTFIDEYVLCTNWHVYMRKLNNWKFPMMPKLLGTKTLFSGRQLLFGNLI